MAHTQHQTMRRVLRREIAGTIGLLTDEHDFTAMRRYRTFTFDDHTTYLQQVESLLRTLAAQGGHTTVALFDPEEYAEFCAEQRPGTRHTVQPHTLHRRTGRDGRHRPLRGPASRRTRPGPRRRSRPPGHLGVRDDPPGPHRQLRVLRRGHRTRAFARASHLLTRVLDTAGPGDRHLVCSVSTAARNTRRRTPGRRRRRRHHPPRRGRGPRIHHRPGPRHRHPERRGTRHAHHRPRHDRPCLRMAPARRRPGTPHRRRGLRRLLHRRRIRRPRLPGIGRRLLRTTRPRGGRAQTTGHTH